MGQGGTITGTGFTPTTSGYYTIDILPPNQSGPGSYDVNLSINGAPAVDLSSASIPLYTGVAKPGRFQCNGSPHCMAAIAKAIMRATNSTRRRGKRQRPPLAKITTALTDTDGSEKPDRKHQRLPQRRWC